MEDIRAATCAALRRGFGIDIRLCTGEDHAPVVRDVDAIDGDAGGFLAFADAIDVRGHAKIERHVEHALGDGNANRNRFVYGKARRKVQERVTRSIGDHVHPSARTRHARHDNRRVGNELKCGIAEVEVRSAS